MSETSTLIQKAVAQGLLGPEILLAPDEPPVPKGYSLLKCLGRGGGGEVHLARDLKLDRLVAIKFLHHASAADMERFRREARFTARLNNPAIIAIYELGETTERPYIAMQYVEGSNLGDAHLDVTGVVRAVREISVALRHAHEAGIVHRDIKPANILIDVDGHAYLTDFGIARSLDGALGDTISHDGQIMGTPALMPPEQARGRLQSIDARSDIYALGATLYAKLTGRPPFHGDGIVEVLHAVIHDPPVLPRSHNVEIPRNLESIIMRCMSKRREDRYQSMVEVVEALDRFLDGQAAEGGGTPWFRRLVSEQHDVPQQTPQDDSTSDPYWSVGMEVVRDLAAWDANLYRVSGSLSPSFERLGAIRARLDDLIAQRPDTAWARFYRGIALFRQGCLDAALEEMERSIDRVTEPAGAHFELGRLYLAIYFQEHRLAHQHVTRLGVEHDLESARPRLNQAVLAFREAERLGGDVPAWMSVCTDAVARLAEGDYQGCIDLCDAIVADEPDIEGAWKLRGDAQRLAGLDPFGSYERAIDVRRSYFEAMHAAAEAHLERDECDAARSLLERAISVHPAFVDGFVLLASTELTDARAGRSARLAEGIELAQQAVTIDGRHFGARVVLAELLHERGRRDDDPGVYSGALSQLDAAETLPGCSNRVNLLRARLRLDLARHARESGDDASGLLTLVLDACEREAATVSESGPWTDLRLEAERLEDR